MNLRILAELSKLRVSDAALFVREVLGKDAFELGSVESEETVQVSPRVHIGNGKKEFASAEVNLKAEFRTLRLGNSAISYIEAMTTGIWLYRQL